MGMCVSCDPVNFWMEEQRRERPACPAIAQKAFLRVRCPKKMKSSKK